MRTFRHLEADELASIGVSRNTFVQIDIEAFKTLGPVNKTFENNAQEPTCDCEQLTAYKYLIDKELSINIHGTSRKWLPLANTSCHPQKNSSAGTLLGNAQSYWCQNKCYLGQESPLQSCQIVEGMNSSRKLVCDFSNRSNVR